MSNTSNRKGKRFWINETLRTATWNERAIKLKEQALTNIERI